MKNIHIVPTDKETRLHDTFGNLRLERGFEPSPCNKNIHITSDEEIKEGEYYIHGERLHKHLGKKCLDVLTDKEYTQSSLINKDSVFKKIILTTDTNLIKDVVQAIDDEFLEWFVKNPSCEEVEIEKGYAFGTFYKIIIPKEEPKRHLIDMMKQDEYLGLYDVCENNILTCLKEKCECKHQKIMKKETLEEVAERIGNNFEDSTFKAGVIYGVIEGAKWQMERSYSEEDLRNAFFSFPDEWICFEEWFEQFKKK